MKHALSLAGLVLTLLPSAATACSPWYNGPLGMVKRGENCSATRPTTHYQAEGLREAEDLGNGFVSQELYSGSGCYNESDTLIMNCATGEVAVLGPTGFGLGFSLEEEAALAKANAPVDKLVARIKASITAGEPMPMEEIMRRAEEAAIKDRLLSNIKMRLGMKESTFRIDCGCRLFYPGLTGGTN